jgi:thiol-disulfide isomerase/thioredoxin
MNDIIELQGDDLEHYVGMDNLIVMFKSDGCGACRKLLPHLRKLENIHTIIIVDSLKHVKSCKFLPGVIKYYPTIAFFNKGVYIKELTQHDIINQTI